MNETLLLVAMAAVTFASRASFLVWRGALPQGPLRGVVRAFPLALFVVLATIGLAAPHGRPSLTPALIAGVAGIIAAVLMRRSLLAVLVVGGGVWWLVTFL